MSYIVAIDGPCGAGKTATAKRIAELLNCMYLDTGAIYRTFAYYVLSNGLASQVEAFERGESLHKMNSFAYTIAQNVNIAYENGQMRTYIGDKDVTSKIRSNDVSDMASRVSVLPAVRSKVLGIERKLARRKAISIIAEGRDIGTIVFPKADVKIYLDADGVERAARRVREHPEDFENMQAAIDEINRRDDRDMNRAHAPLRRAEDAYLVDNTKLTFDETVNTIIAIIKSEINPKWQYAPGEVAKEWRLSINNDTQVVMRLPNEGGEYTGELRVKNTRYKIASHVIPVEPNQETETVQNAMLKELLRQTGELANIVNNAKKDLRTIIEK